MNKQPKEVAEVFADLERARVVVEFSGTNAAMRAFRFAAEWEGRRNAWRTKNGHESIDAEGLGVTREWTFPDVRPSHAGAVLTVEHEGQPGFVESPSWRAGLKSSRSILEQLAREDA